MSENETPRNDIDEIEDLVLTDDELYKNNTFSLRALNQTLEKLSLKNFWSLYQTQRSRLHMERFDIPFNDFLSTTRLTGEKSKTYYPRRHVAYVDYDFIQPELRKRYRRSKLFNVAVNQTEIAEHPDVFQYNHLVFIDGDYIFTTEIYPLEGKTGIIIDEETIKSKHGITYKDYIRYKEENAMVTVFMVPNFYVSNLKTNRYVLEQYNFDIPFNKLVNGDQLTEHTLGFLDTSDSLAHRYYEPAIEYDTVSKTLHVPDNIVDYGKEFYLCSITLPDLFEYRVATPDFPYFQIDTKMPCPKEQMLILVKSEGVYRFKQSVGITMYYPNIYQITGLEEGETALVYILQDDNMVVNSEVYTNELAKYEEYIDMLPEYEDESIPSIIKNYRPSSFVYSINDFQGSIYVPDTMNYKVQKLHKTIYENPWVLATYLDLLNLPTEKFYLDMEKISLDNRIRTDNSREDIDPGQPIINFPEERYVFAMNRHYIDTRSYGFRIFIDGLFQVETAYEIIPGPNYYYIYIPTNLITDTSMIEIERFKLFMTEETGTVTNLEDPIVELDLSGNKMVGYAREIYVVDTSTGLYLPKNSFKIDVLYGYAVNGNRWVTLPGLKNIPIENKVRVYLLDDTYLNIPLKVGIQRTVSMVTGEKYVEPMANDAGNYEYTKVEINNVGGFDNGTYRVFNNGKVLMPIQCDVRFTNKQGGNDIIRTACNIHTGDQFTIDHVPAQYRVIYYQREIDSEGKRGYVDLDGKIPLPLSLKWYDIYLNGVKLHKKNIEILSPTRMYVQGVESRQNLMIVVRDRDPEVFRLPAHNGEMDYNNTIIDDLLDEIDGLKQVIDQTKNIIDPDNKYPNIATGVIRNLDAMIFFYGYLCNTFINANWKQITQEIKYTFPMLLDEQGILPIDCNEGCVPVDENGGYLIKIIECNERSGDMFTDKGVSYDGIGEMQDRFAIRPLNTTNYEFGLPHEFLCDPETGEPAILNEDGTVTALSTLVRTRNHIETFGNNIILYGMGRADIYQVTFDEEFKVHVYNNEENLLTNSIEITEPISQACVGIDASFLIQVNDCKMLKIADIDPTVTVTYTVNGTESNLVCKLSRLEKMVIKVNRAEFAITGITLSGIPEGTRSFIHSLLIAY